ncbi:MAG: tyrosine/phenylalanine carboxypeptidase domain-containing protein, partial [Planctomycetota bacterium]
MSTSEQRVSVDAIRRRLEAGGGVRRTLPRGGRLHIDRLLPFLCVYRAPARRADADTKRLITSQAAYLTAAGDSRSREQVSRIVAAVARTAREEFGEFLLIEVWSGRPVRAKLDEPAVPLFRVHAAEPEELSTTLRALRDGLGPIRIGSDPAKVELPPHAASHPPGLATLSDGPVRWIGIEVAPVWRRADDSYPIILQRLRHGFSRALQRASFRFTRDHTPHRPRHYQALGRRAWVKAAAQVDGRLASIDASFDYLLLMTPTNFEAAYADFCAGEYRREPRLLYRHLPIDPIRVKRSLYDARIERVEDPTLAHLFRQSQRELDLKLSALLERPSQNVLLSNRQIYGDVDPSLLIEAEAILRAIPPRAREQRATETAGAAEFAAAARAEVAAYRRLDAEFATRVSVRDDIDGLMVSRGDLFVGSRVQLPRSRIRALLHHEIGTHAVTFRNGGLQPLHQLRYGLPGYEELQEGLAVLAEYLCGELSRPRLRLLAARVVGVHSLIAGATFVETFDLLQGTWSIPAATAFGITVRVHRGGGMPKDAAYLRGLRAVVDYVGEGGEFDSLLVGKIGFDHLPLVRELRRRGILEP